MIVSDPVFKAPTLESIRTLVAADLAQVEAILRDHPNHIQLSLDICQHVLQAGGKRLRPMVLLVAAHQSGYRGIQHIELAAAMEMVHTATLLHDDVVDDSPLRRGQPTAKQIWGNPSSVLVGDYLYAKSFRLLAGCQNMQITEAVAHATETLAQGELLQLMHRHNLDITSEQHLTILEAKTGKLFEVSALLGGLIADAEPTILNCLREYGMQLGIGFQLIDDVLDYEADPHTLGKRLGDDFLEGNLTLPLIHTLTQGTPSEKNFIKEALKGADPNSLSKLQAILEQNGALAHAKSLAKTYIEQAINAILPLPNTPYRQAMIELAQYAIARSH